MQPTESPSRDSRTLATGLGGETTLTIGELARATGLTTAQLRVWEERFGWPVARRTSGGHRRFCVDDVRLIGEVLTARSQGLRLDRAIEQVTARVAHEQARSVHAAVTRAVPEALPRRLGRPTMLALSQAIEDECLARTEQPVVLGTFQTGERFTAAAPRWRELARTAAWCAAYADFSVEPEPSAGLTFVSLADAAPLRREWTVVCLSNTFQAVLSGWVLPDQRGPRGQTRFEAVLSTTPQAVAVAARTLLALALDGGRAVPDPVLARVDENPLPATGGADRLLARAAAYLDERTR